MPRRPIRLIACLLSLPLPALAQPLGKEECEKLKAEYTRIGQTDLKADLEKGPAWGKSNLPAARLKEIQGYIELEEQFLFRCPQPRIVPLTPEAQAALSAGPAAQSGKPGAAKATGEESGAVSEDGGPAGGLGVIPGDDKPKSKPKKPVAVPAKPAPAAKPAQAKKAAAPVPLAGGDVKPAPIAPAAKPSVTIKVPATTKPAVKVSKPDSTGAVEGAGASATP